MLVKNILKCTVRLGVPVALLLLTFQVGYALNLEISNVNIDNFPGVHIFVRVTDDQGNYIPDLGSANFEVRENGALMDIYVEPEFGYMATTLVMDESGSMSGYENTVIDACSYFVNGMEDLDKGAIVKFATTSSVSVAMTYDKNLLLDSIATYQTTGWTDLYDAIYLGIQECYYEPEKKAVVAFTDGNDNQPGVFAAQLPIYAGSDITIYTIGIGNSISVDSLTYIAEETGGFFLPIENPSQMQEVLEDIRFDLEHLYDVFYTTPDDSLNGTQRALEVVCTYNGQSDWDTLTYTAPEVAPPVITLTQNTAAMLGVSQQPSSTLHIECNIDTENQVDDARIYYKNVTATYYTQTNLTYQGGRTYYADIPYYVVQEPGVYFYIQVTDDHGNTVTLPGYEPGALPLCIPVLNNYAPTIEYEPPTVWLDRRSLPFEVTVKDSLGSVAAVTLYYRDVASYFYTELPLDPVGSDLYYAEIEGPDVNEHTDLQFFIVARDDEDVLSFWQSSDEPFELDVVPELSPTLPVVVLEPDDPQIVIPASGGQFYYTANVINPIPQYVNCDAWAELVRPDGSIEELEVIEDIVLFGGGSWVQAYLQVVPDTAMAGDYILQMHSGDYDEQTIYFTDSFTFTKEGASDSGGPYDRWYWEAVYPDPTENPDPMVLFADDTPSLSRGFPNPFNAVTSLRFYLPENGYAHLIIYNLAGEEVARLADGFFTAGEHRFDWDASQVASGIYFANLITRYGVFTTRLILIK